MERAMPTRMESDPHIDVVEDALLVLLRKEDTACPQVCRHTFEPPPAFQTGMCVDRQLREAVHCFAFRVRLHPEAGDKAIGRWYERERESLDRRRTRWPLT